MYQYKVLSKPQCRINLTQQNVKLLAKEQSTRQRKLGLKVPAAKIINECITQALGQDAHDF